MIGPITAVDKYGNPSINLSNEPRNLKIDLDFTNHLNNEVSTHSRTTNDEN